jgi:predicted dehydrogenase
MVQPVNLGIIGCGDVMTAYMAHARQLRGEGLVQVTWACDRRPEREAFMRQRYGVPHFTLDYQELLASDQVDAVLVLTSMEGHAPLASAALQAGKHVLVEKPLGVTLEEAVVLLETAKTSPGYLVCAPFVMLSPTYQILWERIQRGDIGRVLTARARYGHAGPTWGAWYYRSSGGALFDLAPYNLTSLTGLLGPARRVIAMTGTAIAERVVDGEAVHVSIEDNTHVLVDFGENVFAVVTAAFTMQQYRTPALELYGTGGTLQMLGDDWHPEGYELWLNEVGAWQVYKETDPGWLWTAGLRHLVECIHQGRRPVVSPEQAYHVLEIMVKARESGRDGTAKLIQSRFPRLQLGSAQVDARGEHLVHDRTHKREV